MFCFLFSASRRPIGPGLRVRRFRVSQYCNEPNGNSFSLNSSTEVSKYNLCVQTFLTYLKCTSFFNCLFCFVLQKHDFLEAESSTSDSDMKDIDRDSKLYNVSNQYPV